MKTKETTMNSEFLIRTLQLKIICQIKNCSVILCVSLLQNSLLIGKFEGSSAIIIE